MTSPFYDEFDLLPRDPDDIRIEKEKSQEKLITVARTLDSYPTEIQSETLRRYQYINWFKEKLNGGWTKKNIEPLLVVATDLLPPPFPTWRTLARWWRAYSQGGEKIIALVPNHNKKGNKRKRLPKMDEYFFELALAEYLMPERPSIKFTHNLYAARVRVENLKLVDQPIKSLSYSGFYKRIKSISAFESMKARYGKFKANSNFRAVGAHLPPSRIMERVEVDHTPLDLILLDDQLFVPLGRPYLTALIDCYSNCIVGFNLGFKEPGFYSVREALLHTIKPKSYVKDRYPEVKHDWPCYGKPETLIVDNGVEFWCQSLEQACLELGINIQYNPIRRPWLKPRIERLNGTINRSELIEPMPGKTFNNILERDKYDPAKDAVMRFSSFLDLFHRWIIDIYHYNPDSRYRYIPIDSWERSFAKINPAPLFEEDLKNLEVILSLTKTRTHRSGGVHIKYLSYDSDELANFRKRYSSKQKGNQKVLVKLNPSDISYVYVFIKEIDSYVKVPCVDPIGYTTGLSLQKHLINVRLHKMMISNKVDLDGLAIARVMLHERIQREIEDLRNFKHKPRTKSMAILAKHQGVGSQGASSIVPEAGDMINRLKTNSQSIDNIEKSNEISWDDFVSSLDAY